jgi:class 3 adenylate cyclase
VRPTTRYAKSGDLHIAYAVMGDGPLDLVYVPTWISQLEHLWEEPRVERFFNRISSFARLIMFDRRGSGLSDPIPDAPTLEEQMDDVLAVLDAAGSERAALLAQLEGGTMACMFAATHPERTGALILFSAWSRIVYDEGYEWANKPEEREEWLRDLTDSWGREEHPPAIVPSAAEDPRLRAWFAKLERLAASPGAARKLMKVMERYDVRDVLSTIRVPTLVMNRKDDDAINPLHSRYLAEHIPGARYLEFPGRESLTAFGDNSEAVLDEIEEFLTGTRQRREADRVLATVLFTDIVGSTQRAAQLGDTRWRRLLADHDQLIVREIDRHRGRFVKSVGDGVLATFDGPARGINCTRAVLEGVAELGLEVRAGLHTGEAEVIGDDVGGLAVHIAARVSQAARAGEVLVSGTVKDLVVGSGLEFEDRGTRELRGVPGEWRLFAVA